MFEQFINLFEQIVICLNKLLCVCTYSEKVLFRMSSAGLRTFYTAVIEKIPSRIHSNYDVLPHINVHAHYTW